MFSRSSPLLIEVHLCTCHAEGKELMLCPSPLTEIHDWKRKRSSKWNPGQSRPLLISPHYPSVCFVLYSFRRVCRGYEYCDETFGFLRASSSQKHQYRLEFLTEVGANSNNLTAALQRRLSKGRVLERFWANRNEINMFLEQQKNHKPRGFAQFLEDEINKACYGLLGWHKLTPKWHQPKTAGQEQLSGGFGRSCLVFSEEVGDLYKAYLQGACAHFSSNETIHSNQFIQKLILLFILNTSLVKNVTVFFTQG